MEIKFELLYYQHVHFGHVLKTKNRGRQPRLIHVKARLHGRFLLRFHIFMCDFLLLIDAKEWISVECLW